MMSTWLLPMLFTSATLGSPTAIRWMPGMVTTLWVPTPRLMLVLSSAAAASAQQRERPSTTAERWRRVSIREDPLSGDYLSSTRDRSHHIAQKLPRAIATANGTYLRGPSPVPAGRSRTRAPHRRTAPASV